MLAFKVYLTYIVLASWTFNENEPDKKEQQKTKYIVLFTLNGDLLSHKAKLSFLKQESFPFFPSYSLISTLLQSQVGNARYPSSSRIWAALSDPDKAFLKASVLQPYSPKPWKRQVYQSLTGLVKRLLVEAPEVEGGEEEEERVEELGQQRQMGRLMVKRKPDH